MSAIVESRVAWSIRKDWGWMALRGACAVAFGALALVSPKMTLFVLIIAYGAYALVDGIASLVFLARGGRAASGKMWPLLLTGVAGVVAGLVAFTWPGLTSVLLLYVVAFWALARGAFEVMAYFPLRKQMPNAGLLLLSGLLSLALGFILFAAPVSGILALLWVLGIYAIIDGAVLIGLAFAMRSALKERAPALRPSAPPTRPTPA